MLFIDIVSATTLTVNGNSGADYNKIQDAINASSDGDTILVYSGTYNENVDVNKQLVLRGVDNGGGKPVVDASGSIKAINLRAGNSVLEGFTVINAGNAGNILHEQERSAAGIRVGSNNNIIRNNTALNNEHGIRVMGNSSNNNVSDNTIINNYIGIDLPYSNNNKVSGNNISNNSAVGIYLWYSNNNVITGNNLINNDIVINESSNYNILYQNKFINCHNIDDGINQWDNGINTGNYWSDYTGTDANSDGIGDTSYNIMGKVMPKDRYPLMSSYGGTTTTDSFSDDFNGSSLNSGWIVINKNNDSIISLTGTGILRMNASPKNGGSDYYNSSNFNAIRILQPLPTDIVGGMVEIKMNFLPTNNYQGAGIIACYDVNPDSNTCERYAERAFYPQRGGSVVRAFGKYVSYSNSTTYFRLMNNGINYYGWYSSDGVNWILNGQGTSASTTKKAKYLGLFVIRQPWDGDMSVYSVADFDYFKITPLDPSAQIFMPEITQTPKSSSTSSSEGWQMFRHDTEHTGTYNGVVEFPLNLKWEYKKKHENVGFSSPAISNGIVYFGSEDSHIYALNTNTGDLKWDFKTEGAVKSSPAVSGDIVYVGSQDNYVYAIDANTGSLIWKYKTITWVLSSPAVFNGIVYVGSMDSYVYALDARTGSLKWKYKTGDRVLSSPTVSNGILFIGSRDNFVYALDANTGHLKWKFKTDSWVESSPAVSGGVIYVGSDDTYLYALDVNTGNLKWKYKTEDKVGSSPAISKGIVYIGPSDGHVYALDAETGDLKWKYNHYGTNQSVDSSLAIFGEVVYVSYVDLLALDAETGNLKWKSQISKSMNWLSSSPVISGDSVYVSSQDSYVAFGPLKSSISAESSDDIEKRLPSPSESSSSIFGRLTQPNLLAILLIGLGIVYLANSIFFKKENSTVLKCSGCGHLVPKNPYCAYCGKKF